MTNTIILIALILIGIFDLYLYFTGQKTLSQGWGFDRLGIKLDPPRWALSAILVILLILVWWVFDGIDTFVKVLIGVIMGHLFWKD